jgi:hypothetical protein
MKLHWTTLLANEYGLTEKPNGDFESARNTYFRKDVLHAMGVDEYTTFIDDKFSAKRDVRMKFLRALGVPRTTSTNRKK